MDYFSKDNYIHSVIHDIYNEDELYADIEANLFDMDITYNSSRPTDLKVECKNQTWKYYSMLKKQSDPVTKLVTKEGTIIINDLVNNYLTYLIILIKILNNIIRATIPKNV